MSEDLSDFLKQKESKANEEQVNWMKVKENYLNEVSIFFDTINNWIKNEVKQGLLKENKYKNSLQEYQIGTYQVDALGLQTKYGKAIRIEPVGANFMGVKGRIDIYLNNTRMDNPDYYVVLTDSGWRLVKNGQTVRNSTEFNQSAFTNILKEAFQ
ncbi:hypothetical protein PP175_25545 (plasmid) [Aneurinibacillus sp. Ricciae_BoGa-3]|uniref:hypothetical protein n=1 Tax=Aneurinibacillus sp. Ricciae_BoGa-3 TaxID=3022697 RepID=UPI0023411671|nr:hypothetical protein [Aneurinibacillus sp. Ricciae_BoGa-3]WCK57434.1 hypothetical protein PP175_25545 [Aneurinibacillus sp. Ricciae_BoGa-3]